MKVLIYKRTHKGDPDSKGIFGIQDCMGRIRDWNYDAVIGIGGNSPWKKDFDIKHKINWIGIEPKKTEYSTERGNMVVFSHFKLYEENGENIKDNYPNLFEHMYGSRKRFDMSSELPKEVLEEVKKILDSIKDSPASKAYEITYNDTLETGTISSSKCSRCLKNEDFEITIKV
ncbi:MAG: hypothetical protein H6Q13_3496 [Bacteroidetes bacterium]|nr:hypothetical protein [Bacteroidota bacterium]